MGPSPNLVLESKFLSFKTPFSCEGLFPENCKKTPSKIIAWKFCPEIPDKTNLAGNSKAKNQDQQWKFHFLLVTLGTSTSFLINPCKFHMLFLWYPPVCFFLKWPKVISIMLKFESSEIYICTNFTFKLDFSGHFQATSVIHAQNVTWAKLKATQQILLVLAKLVKFDEAHCCICSFST